MKYTFKTFLFTIFLMACFAGHHTLSAQEKGLIQSKYYSPDDYAGSAQNWAVAQDKRGVMYFGNVGGVLEFDGETWRLISVANESSVRSLAVDGGGTLFIGAFNEMGFLKPTLTGGMQYQSLMPLLGKEIVNFGEIWDINCFSDTVFFLSDRYLFRYINGKIDYWESKTASFYLSHNINGNYFVQEMGKGLMKFENNSLHLIDKGDFFTTIKIHSIFPIKDGYLICTRTDGCFIYSNLRGQTTIKSLASISTKAKKVNDYFIENSFYHGVVLANQMLAMGSISGDILIVDQDWNVRDIINAETLGIKSATHFLYFQDNHLLWLALDNGICQVEVLSPFRYWNQAMGVNGVITDVARMDDILYISTGAGVFYTIDPQGNTFELNSFFPVDGKFEQSWGFLYFQLPLKNQLFPIKNQTIPNKQTKLLVATTMGLFQINKEKSEKISNYDILFKVYQSRKDPSKLILGLNNGVAELSYENGQWMDLGRKYGIDSKVLDIGEDTSGNIWLNASYKGLYRIKNPFAKDSNLIKVDLFDTSSNLPTVKSVRIFDDSNPMLFYSDRKYYSFNEKSQKFELYDLVAVNDSIEKSEHKFVDTLAWNRVWDNVISGLYVTNSTDSIIWVSTTSGIFRYTPGYRRNYLDLSPAMIRKVTMGDSVLYNGTNFEYEKDSAGSEVKGMRILPSSTINIGTILKYRNNSLTFTYSWPFFEGDKQKVYSYRLVGYDENWSEWKNETKKEYTNLPEGDYTFCVRARNLYDLESPMAEFKFEILPPWYRTYLAYFGYLTLGILLIFLIVKLYTYSLLIEKDRLEGLVKERTQEILIQKEEILVQAEHLKDANEWITAKNAELELQKYEVEKKKNQLEESNNTKNKFFRIVAHDLRNPISTLVNSTGYILTDIDDFDKQKTKRFIEQLNRLSLTTYNLLENLLDWASSQMGEIKYNPSSLNLCSLIKENIELVQNKMDLKHISLSMDVSEFIQVIADENMLRTVIRNLISNAAKFTKDFGTINIYARVENTVCYLNIADNGVGISKENLEKLFKIDKEVITHGTHNEKGSGLGLILCKEFVERNGGTITVESELGKGSTFTISLKLA